MRVFRAAARFTWRVLSTTTGIAALLAVLFVAWRIPTERAERRALFTEVELDDGPHVFWLDEERARVVSIGFDRPRSAFTLKEETLAGEAVAAQWPSEQGRTGQAVPTAGAVWTAPRIAAVSDVHGGFNALTRLLQQAGVVDGQLNWGWRAGHLVVLGDVFDRGPGVTRSLWLLRKLEGQALAAGGRVHCLLGNHDLLALTGRSRVPHPKYLEIEDQLGLRYPTLFGRDTELGRWVRTWDTIARINDVLFVHAGISQETLAEGLTLDDINRLVRASLASDHLLGLSPRERAACRVILGRQGVLWHRGTFDRSFPTSFFRAWRGDLVEAPAASAVLDRALAQYGGRRLVVGHTTSRTIRSLYGGRLLAICLGGGGDDVPSRTARGELLLLDGARTERVDLAGARSEVR